MGFDLQVSVPVLTVFIQGILSFLSPCVLPLLPVYIGYLAGGATGKNAEGETVYPRGRVLLHTVCFVAGVSFAFFLLGLGMNAVALFFHNGRVWFVRIGGVLVILFGLYQLGVFGHLSFVERERKLSFHPERMAMSPLAALLMGFLFSFAWSPCVGPTLASVLLIAAGAGEGARGFFLLAVYTVGFTLPFLLVGLFTTSLLAFFRKHRQVVRYTTRAGGILMIAMGLLMITGQMNRLASYLAGFGV